MSDETLRRAAAEIRSDWSGRHGGGWQKVAAFNLAVADWLDMEAEVMAGTDSPERAAALAVANAYLGAPR